MNVIFGEDRHGRIIGIGQVRLKLSLFISNICY